VVFGRVVSGYCRFQLPGAAEQSLEPGDCLLLTEPPAWILRGGAGKAAITAFEDLPADTASPEPGRSEDDPNQVRVVGGHFEFDSVNKELLMAFLSPVAHIRSPGPGDGGRLAGVLAMIDAEASAARPGQQAVLSRLLDIVLIELLRMPEMLPGQQRGMLTGLADPQIASALRAFHADIRRNWSVASMATEARMSRSVFSQRFTSLIGQPPMTYALHWRMAVACDALRFSGRSLGEIALATGYGSFPNSGSTADSARIAQGDNFLAGVVPLIMASDAYQDHGVIVLWWDESEGGDDPSRTLPFIIISKDAHKNVDGVPYSNTITYSHSSFLRTMQEIFDVDPQHKFNWLGGAATATDLSDLFERGAIK